MLLFTSQKLSNLDEQNTNTEYVHINDSLSFLAFRLCGPLIRMQKWFLKQPVQDGQNYPNNSGNVRLEFPSSVSDRQ